MAYMIQGKNADELFINLAKSLLKDGKRNAPRGLETIELTDAWLTLDNPSESIVTLPERDLNLDYLAGELEWYESGSLKVEDIVKHSRFWNKLADSNRTINSNYGFLVNIEKFNGISQLEWCVNSLNKDSNTRQALINYSQPRYKYKGNKDQVCTISQQFVKRDGALDSVVLMRSNDVIFGLSYDIVWFTKLQQQVSDETGIPMGKYYHYASSMHVYKRHFKMLEKIANAEVK